MAGPTASDLKPPSTGMMQKLIDEAVLAERRRLIRMVEDRAIKQNGPFIVTLELNQLAAWMDGKDWNGIQPPKSS